VDGVFWDNAAGHCHVRERQVPLKPAIRRIAKALPPISKMGDEPEGLLRISQRPLLPFIHQACRNLANPSAALARV